MTEFRNYTYFSIVSFEVVKYHEDFLYLLCGTDQGKLFSFWYNDNLIDEILDGKDNGEVLFNFKSTAMGNSPVYLKSMNIEGSETDLIDVS